MFERVGLYFLARFREPSTWRGLVALLASFGLWHFGPEQTQAIIMFALLLMGSVGVLAPDPVVRSHPERVPSDDSAAAGFRDLDRFGNG